MLPSTSFRLQQGPTHVTDTGRCSTPYPNLTEVIRLGQLSLCCSQLGASPSSRICLVLFPALWLSRTAVCTATELLVCCSQDLFDLQTTSVLRPDRRGEPVITLRHYTGLACALCNYHLYQLVSRFFCLHIKCTLGHNIRTYTYTRALPGGWC